MIIRTFQAFFLRDFRQNLSYKLSFFLDVASVFFNAATFYFVAKLFDASTGSHMQEYGGTYFPFVLIGIAFSTYQTTGLTSFSQSLRQEQYMGTIESILVSPINISTFLAGSALWDFFYASFEVAFYFLVAFLAFGLLLPNINYLPALASIGLTLTTFMGLGILAAAFILRFKRGNPVTWVIATSSELLGGVYFPTTILPDWMKSISDWVPMTHALGALRKTFLSHASFSDIQNHLLYLVFFTVVVWILGIAAFQWALKKSQTDGSLGHY
jgi:ABC-2 type transport system permease protein